MGAHPEGQEQFDSLRMAVRAKLDARPQCDTVWVARLTEELVVTFPHIAAGDIYKAIFDEAVQACLPLRLDRLASHEKLVAAPDGHAWPVTPIEGFEDPR